MIRIQRSYPAPAALAAEKAKSGGTYRHPEILDRLSKDFHGKCYICEDKNPHKINVEHLVSHRGNRDLKFDWDNLFWSCAHCNNIKLQHYDDILDCTKEDVEDCIRYKMDMLPMAEVKITALKDEPRVHKTVELLLKVYNGCTNMTECAPLAKMESRNLRDTLFEELRKLQGLVYEYIQDDLETDEEESLERQIKRHLTRNSAFTAFKHWLIKDNKELMAEFGQYIA